MNFFKQKLKKIRKKLTGNVPAGNNLTVRDDDIFIVSYPRSGNTWMRFLLGSLFFENKIDWTNLEDMVPDIYINSDKKMLELASPRLIKSHHPYDSRYKKVIYIVRDVRDVVLSYYKWHLKMKESYNEDFQSFFKKFIAGDLDSFGDWGTNVRSWLNNKEEVEYGFLFLKYEDLMDDTFNEIKKAVDFLNLDRSDEVIEDAIEWSSFENMKELEKKQRDKVDLFKNTRKDIDFVRKAKVKGWEGILSDKQKQRISVKFGGLLSELDYL